MKEFGLELQASPDGDGVEILSVDPESVAAEKGLAKGNVIQSVAGKKVNSIEDVQKQMNEAKNGNRKTILMRVKTSNGVRFVALPLKNY